MPALSRALGWRARGDFAEDYELQPVECVDIGIELRRGGDVEHRAALHLEFLAHAAPVDVNSRNGPFVT